MVVINGLPSGADGNVSVVGPSSLSESFTATEAFTGLTPGVYALSATSVNHDGTAYRARR